MKNKLKAILVAVVVFASFFGLTQLYISQHVQFENVVGAAENISPRTKITKDNITIKQVPKATVPDTAAPSLDIFAETEYFTGEIGLHAGEILTKEKVFTYDDMDNSDTLLLEDNETIVGIETDLPRSAGASIRPGSRVRAWAYISPPVEGAQSNVELIFDNLKVLGVVNAEATATDEEDRSRIPAVVRVAATPEQEKVLIKYQEDNKIWLTVLPEDYEPDPTLEDYFARTFKQRQRQVTAEEAVEE